jgi:asparagine synthase (glutamine-hydrolysing)
VLTGEGADEIFGGYNIFREVKARHFLARQPESRMRLMVFRKLYPYIFKDSRAGAMQQSFFVANLDNLGDPLSSHMIRWQNTGRIRRFLSEGVRAAFDFEVCVERIRRALPASFDSWDSLSKAQYIEMVIFMSNYLLSSQGDRVAMAHSVEIRLPFLDFRLIEFMSRVPPGLKIFGLKEKYILKKTFSDLVPAAILKRDKHPYRAPISQSFFHPRSYPSLSEYLSADCLKRSGLFDVKKAGLLQTKIRKQANTSEVDNMALAGILSTQIIHDQFIARFTYDRDMIKRPDLFYDYRTGNQEGYSSARA